MEVKMPYDRLITIDFLIPVAGAGGVERVLDTVALYLQGNGFHVRLVQLTSDGSRWFSPELELYTILINQKVDSFDEFTGLYIAFLEQYGAPDMTIAVTWPLLVVTAKKALTSVASPAKVFSWLHGPLDEYARYGAGGLECLYFADHHLCISEQAAHTIRTAMPSASISVVHNPVNIEQYIPQTTYHSDSRTLLYVGRLSQEKRIDIIVHAISAANKLHPDAPWKLRIAGTGNLGSQLKELVHELDLDSFVTFSGWLSNPWSQCDDITACVLASEYEGSPLCAIESLANGIPVLSTPVDGISELIVPGINGWLYPHNDSGALCDVLCNIADGTLPSIDPIACTRSVEEYRSSIALNCFRSALINAMDCISVIIPCHNSKKYIRRCLDSILAQDITGVKLEIICVDDCSSDNTLDILSEYEQRFPDLFILIPLSQNMRQGYARNVALSYSTGNYITYVDSDDCVSPELLRQLYTYIKLYKCDVAECTYSQFDDNTPIPEAAADGNISFYDMSNLESKRAYVMNRYWKTAPWGRLYTRQLLTDNNILFAEGVRMEDILFSAECMCAMQRYILIPGNYYYYYLNSSGTMFSTEIHEYYLDTVNVEEQAADFLSAHGWYSDCLEEFEYAHYAKAFEEPVWRMCSEPALYYRFDTLIDLKEKLLKRFPDICNNRYLNSSNSETASICLQLLSANLDEEALNAVFMPTL